MLPSCMTIPPKGWPISDISCASSWMLCASFLATCSISNFCMILTILIVHDPPCFFTETSLNLPSTVHRLLHLGYLGWGNTNRTNPNCVASPQVANSSAVLSVIVVGSFLCDFHWCKVAFTQARKQWILSLPHAMTIEQLILDTYAVKQLSYPATDV